ncbi:DUF3455 domain-containing protein [Cryptosporangium phraense]|uniref:DUF3455 domain-containing protein n=1 Tax=Cryptosporangium phraense TaxID=2593070 RepID=A0A545ATT5_9ACTN|nr:DUF3455 domain-containing protein [Cryptosporangium phraense]TQS44750.1 DUF3455 domain-containing protein [Cryptosporangium phraense]
MSRKGGRRVPRAALALAGAAALALGVAPGTAQASQASPGGHSHGPQFTLPAGAPSPGAGFRIQAAYKVVRGTQTYTCAADGTWGTAGSTPEAQLAQYGGYGRIHHYAGPRWTSLRDGSTLLGTVVADATQQKPPSIPWLLLTTAVEKGSKWSDLGRVTNISRVNTTGGARPTGACTPGQTQAVPYGADYVFWVPTA